MTEFDLLDPISSWFFYVGRVTKLKDVTEYGTIGERNSHATVGRFPFSEGRVEAFVCGDPPFVVKGLLLLKFVEIAGPIVSEICNGRHRRTYRFATFGTRSIELVSDRVGIECSAEVYAVSEDLLDERERLVVALNEAVDRMMKTI